MPTQSRGHATPKDVCPIHMRKVMPQISLPVGNSRWDVTISTDRLLALKGDGLTRAPVADPRAAVREAMEHPLGLEFPLRKGLTPDDHVTIVIDQMLPRLAELVAGVLDYVVGSGIEPGSITLLTSSSSHQGWVDDLPDEFADVKTEVHNPADRKRLSYLASTSDGRRLYLNRSLVDAEQSILLTGRGFDPILGHSGAELLIYPILSDNESRRAVVERFGTEGADAAGVIRGEAREAAWLFGSPFLIQVIEGEGDTLTSIFAGMMDSTEEGVRRQDAAWQRSVSQQADIVLATISGSPAGQRFLDACPRGQGCAPGGRQGWLHRGVKRGGTAPRRTGGIAPRIR